MNWVSSPEPMSAATDVETTLEPCREDQDEDRDQDGRGVEDEERGRLAREVGDDRVGVTCGLLPVRAERHRGLDRDDAQDAGRDAGPRPGAGGAGRMPMGEVGA